MAQKKHTADRARLETVRAALTDDVDWLKPLIQEVLQQVLEAERDECVGAAKGERSDARSGYPSGHYRRGLVTCVGKLELRV